MDNSLFSVFVLDGAACALLAAAATVRARRMGAHVTGALVLGCLCGLIGPLLREVFLHGAPGAGVIARAFPADALAGACMGLAALFLFRNFGKLSSQLFGWLDNAGIGMATGAGSVMAFPELGLAGALTLGLINGLAPGLVRDMALGDTAMLVDKSWYATVAALGSIAAIAVLIATASARGGIIASCLAVIIIRSWKTRNAVEE